MIDERTLKVFRSVFGKPAMEISDEMSAADIPEWDSLMHIQLIVGIEKEFGIKFKNSEIAKLKSIGDLRALIVKHKPAS